MPTYIVRDDKDKPHEIGPVEGSNPHSLPPARVNPEFMKTSLKTHDIQGCKADTSGLGSFHTRERRGWLQTNITNDIPGAQTSTLKKSPTTKR